MAFSYSFHISAKSHAVTNMGKVAQVGKHNTRAYESVNYDHSLIEIVVGSDNIIQDMKHMYHEQFDDVLAKYNEGKRADRRIYDYLEHVSNSRNDVGVEIIIQIGDEEYWVDKSIDERRKMTPIFKEQLNELDRLCPEFKVANAVIHYDEKSPHIHIVGVPVASGYAKGMERQCAKTKVFTKSSLSMLQDKMRENAEMCMESVPELFAQMRLKPKEKGRNKDIPKAMLSEFYELQKEIEGKESELADTTERLEEKTEKIKTIDTVAEYISTEKDEIALEEMTIPEKKTIFGRVEEPERRGVFVENMTGEQVQALMDHIKVDEGLERAMEGFQRHCSAIIKNAEKEAKEIKAEVTVERNETVAKAQDIVRRQNSIIKSAKDWAEGLKQKYKELTDSIKELLGIKEKLEGEIASIQSERASLEPLRQEVEELTRARDIMACAVDNKITQAKFKDWSEMGLFADYSEYRKRGELLALYHDGTIRKVGSNENGGWDAQTLKDKEKGLCRVGIMQEEERVRVPKNLLKELISKISRDEKVSPELRNLIQQQTEVDRAIKENKGRSR